jgi:diadenosine tetraphosphate (Ap4A) HIT family hydrolase
MNECIFCKIIKGEVPSFKIWEDDEFLAILDINPNTKGMTLVLTKEHFDSDAFEMPDDVYQKLMLASKKVSKILKRGLRVKRVVMVMEGMGVNHAHIKLYPLYELKEGGISTALGPKADFEELKQLAERLKNS